MLDDGDIVQCLQNTIYNNSNSFDQSTISNISMNLTRPILSPPLPIKLTHEEMKSKREEIRKFYQNDNSIHSSASNDNLSM